MTKNEFIFQGFTARTHGEAVRELFDVPDIKRVILSVAFVNASGVEQIEARLKPHAASLFVLAGIRNDVTTYQGLSRLHKIGGKVYTVDTGSRTVVFHPKLYLVHGKANARMIVGSANLTLGGLNNNIEAGMLLEFDLTDDADRTAIEKVEALLVDLPAAYPDHVVLVETAGYLDELLAGGRVLDEMAIPPPKPLTSAGASTKSDTVPRIKLKVTPLRRALKKASPASKKPSAAKPDKDKKAAKLVPVISGVEFELVWGSKPLTRRDLTIPDAAGTHATGSVNLDRGLLADEVDHRRYFRDDVFSGLTWAPTNATGKVEETFAKFQLVIKGISYGEFDLRIGHTTSKSSKAYKQRNAMTRLSWGPMREFIARPDLIGRTLALYRDKIDSARFVLEID